MGVEPLTDGLIAPKITLADFRRLTEFLPDDTLVQIDSPPLGLVRARKVQVTYAAANTDQQSKVVIG